MPHIVYFVLENNFCKPVPRDFGYEHFIESCKGCIRKRTAVIRYVNAEVCILKKSACTLFSYIS